LPASSTTAAYGALINMGSTRKASTATAAEPGMVITQVLTISLALPQRTALGRSEAPIPMIDELTTWVVETGAPIIEAPKITEAEVN